VSIPLGYSQGGARRDALRHSGHPALIIVGYAIPGFLFAILLLVLFAGGSYWQIFPLRG
jgi:ABC-type microcin C transport system permease subunit YejB